MQGGSVSSFNREFPELNPYPLKAMSSKILSGARHLNAFGQQSNLWCGKVIRAFSTTALAVLSLVAIPIALVESVASGVLATTLIVTNKIVQPKSKTLEIWTVKVISYCVQTILNSLFASMMAMAEFLNVFSLQNRLPSFKPLVSFFTYSSKYHTTITITDEGFHLLEAAAVQFAAVKILFRHDSYLEEEKILYVNALREAFFKRVSSFGLAMKDSIFRDLHSQQSHLFFTNIFMNMRPNLQVDENEKKKIIGGVVKRIFESLIEIFSPEKASSSMSNFERHIQLMDLLRELFEEIGHREFVRLIEEFRIAYKEEMDSHEESKIFVNAMNLFELNDFNRFVQILRKIIREKEIAFSQAMSLEHVISTVTSEEEEYQNFLVHCSKVAIVRLKRDGDLRKEPFMSSENEENFDAGNLFEAFAHITQLQEILSRENFVSPPEFRSKELRDYGEGVLLERSENLSKAKILWDELSFKDQNIFQEKLVKVEDFTSQESVKDKEKFAELWEITTTLAWQLLKGPLFTKTLLIFGEEGSDLLSVSSKSRLEEAWKEQMSDSL